MMSKMCHLWVVPVLTLMTTAVIPVSAQQTEVHRVQDALEVFQALTTVPEHGVPAALMRQVYGIAILPDVQRAGFIIGGQHGRGVLVVRSVDRVLRGKYTMGVDASLAAGSLGREAGAVTDQDLRAEIYSYSRTRGIFAGVAVQGASLEVDYSANALYYGKEISKPLDVLAGVGLTNPPSAVQLSLTIGACIANLK
ncbi:MAG: lipid-binding SYLF domain-containing protein [Spirochaetia bacterium]